MNEYFPVGDGKYECQFCFAIVENTDGHSNWHRIWKIRLKRLFAKVFGGEDWDD